MDLHRLAEERSVAYHQRIAEYLLVDRDELTTELRQSSPFAGALESRERWRIFRETRDRFATQH